MTMKGRVHPKSAAGLSNDWGPLQIPLPPVPEQHQIVKYIDETTSTLDALQSGTRFSISLLKERRAALIAATVTGQIDTITDA